MDVQSGSDTENRSVWYWAKHGGKNQQWDLVYVEDMDRFLNPPKGGFNRHFGLYVERPFHIVSELPSHRYLDVNGNDAGINAPNGSQSQVWFFDGKTKTIKNNRFKNKSLNIHNPNSKMPSIMAWATSSTWTQMFRYEGQHLLNLKNGKAIDVQGGQDKEQQKTVLWKKHGGANQKWKILYLDAKPTGFRAGKAFSIVSQLPSKRYLTFSGNNFVIKAKQDSPQQLFMYDAKTKTIATYANQKKVFDIADEGKSRDLIAQDRNGRWDQQFNIRGEHILNIRGLALDVSGGRDKEGQNVIVWRKHNGKNQKWNIVYKDEDTVQTGIIPDKPFRLVTKMRSGRVLTRAGNNVVIRSRNDKEDQIFVMDSKTNTIEPSRNRKVSLDIGDGGKNRYLTW